MEQVRRWLIVVGVLLLGACGGTSTGSDAPSSPPGPDVPRAAGAGEASVYWVLAEPRSDSSRLATAEGSLLTRRTVPVPDGAEPAVAAVRALMTEQRPGPGLLNAPVAGFRRDGEPFDVVSVEHEEGLVTVDFSADFYDPCPTCRIVLPSATGSIVQQYVLTAQAAFDTDDPVLFTAGGEPVQGMWFEQLDGPVEADHSLVVPPYDPSSSVVPADLATSDWRPGDDAQQALGTGTLALREGCVVLEEPGGSTTSVRWPAGWTAWVVEDRLVLLDAQGAIAARGGDQVSVGGGFSTPRGDRPCVLDDATEVFTVQSEVVVRGG